MSDLTRFRDYCRKMAKARTVIPQTNADRALWTQLADEIDHWLATDWLKEPELDTAPLWGDA